MHQNQIYLKVAGYPMDNPTRYQYPATKKNIQRSGYLYPIILQNPYSVHLKNNESVSLSLPMLVGRPFLEKNQIQTLITVGRIKALNPTSTKFYLLKIIFLQKLKKRGRRIHLLAN